MRAQTALKNSALIRHLCSHVFTERFVPAVVIRKSLLSFHNYKRKGYYYNLFEEMGDFLEFSDISSEIRGAMVIKK